TFPNSIIVLFQMCTTAGWSGVFQALTNDQPPDCDPTINTPSRKGDCGNTAIATPFLESYVIIITSLVVIIAVSSHSSRQLYLNKRNIMAEPLICPLCNSIIGNSIDGIAIYACGHMIHGECFYDLHHQKQIDTVANITLNTCSIGRTNSMFIPYIFNITNSCLKL
ncbi:unnamed protein product, partial [Rotaria sordida]